MTLEEMLRNVAGETMVNRLHSGELQPVTETTQISDAVHDQADAADLAARRRAGLASYGRQALGFMPHVQGATWSPDEKRAFLTSAVDPFGATSGLLDRFSPGTGEALRAQYTGHPIEAATGGMATPMPGVNMLRGLTSAGGLMKSLPLAGILTAASSDEALGGNVLPWVKSAGQVAERMATAPKAPTAATSIPGHNVVGFDLPPTTMDQLRKIMQKQHQERRAADQAKGAIDDATGLPVKPVGDIPTPAPTPPVQGDTNSMVRMLDHLFYLMQGGK